MQQNAEYFQFAALGVSVKSSTDQRNRGGAAHRAFDGAAVPTAGRVLLLLGLALKGPAGLAEALPPRTMHGDESALAPWPAAPGYRAVASVFPCYLAKGAPDLTA